jgi:hypothetical protein
VQGEVLLIYFIVLMKATTAFEKMQMTCHLALLNNANAPRVIIAPHSAFISLVFNDTMLINESIILIKELIKKNSLKQKSIQKENKIIFRIE